MKFLLAISLLVNVSLTFLWLLTRLELTEAQSSRADLSVVAPDSRVENPSRKPAIFNFPIATYSVAQPTSNSLGFGAPSVMSSQITRSYLDALSERSLTSIAQQYAPLLDLLDRNGSETEKIKALLIEREQLASNPLMTSGLNQEAVTALLQEREDVLRQIDAEISLHLTPDASARYDLLKESHYEQSQVLGFFDETQYLGEVDSLTKSHLLMSRLEMSRDYKLKMAHLGNDITAAQGDEKSYLIEQARNRLHEYKDAYLQAARGSLSDAHYDALREREQKAFDEAWQSLLAGWGG